MDVENLFHHILKPALGCTEPVAVALASAAAYGAAFGWTPKAPNTPIPTPTTAAPLIKVQVSRSVFKNGFAIAIPNSEGRKGIAVSAALGLFCDPLKSLSLFEDIAPHYLRVADDWVRSQRVKIEVANVPPSEVYIRVEVICSGSSGTCTIRGEHARIRHLTRNGIDVYRAGEGDSGDATDPTDELKSLRFEDLVRMVEDLPEPVIKLIQRTIAMNLAACEAGIERPMGIGTGYFGVDGERNAGALQQMSSLTAAGSDARMSGHPLEIMTSAGSGNQGIMATIPIVVYARGHQVRDQHIVRAVALSHLVTMYLTTHIGYLSALCGVAIKAGIGAACGLTYAMGGGADEIGNAVNIMAATLTGMICDGAKASCALKVSNTSDMAMRAATLAMKQARVPDDNGVVGRTPEETVQHIAQLSRSMETVDANIVQIMLTKAGSSGDFAT